MKRFFYKSQQTAVGAVLLTVFLLLLIPESARARLKSAIGGLFLPVIGISTTGQVALESIGQLGATGSESTPTNQALGQAPASLLGGASRRKTPGFRECKSNNSERIANGVGSGSSRGKASWCEWSGATRSTGGGGSRSTLAATRGFASINRSSPPRAIWWGGFQRLDPLTSWVVLAGDPNCRFSALIKESRSQGGIVSPRQYSSDLRAVELTYLPNDVELRPGQAVVTSGLGGGFPKEIPVGLVVDSWLSKDGLYVEARIKLHANLNQLETVRVLTRF